MRMARCVLVLTVVAYAFLAFVAWDPLFPAKLGGMPAALRVYAGMLTVAFIGLGAWLWLDK